MFDGSQTSCTSDFTYDGFIIFFPRLSDDVLLESYDYSSYTNTTSAGLGFAAPDSTSLRGGAFCHQCPLRPCRTDAASTLPEYMKKMTNLKWILKPCSDQVSGLMIKIQLFSIAPIGELWVNGWWN